MAESYLDDFRDAFVKRGQKIKRKSPCPQCKNIEIEEVEIIRTSADSRERRNAGSDFICPKCWYKWKVMDQFVRPGLHIRDTNSNKEYSRKIAKELKAYLDERYTVYHEQWKNHLEKEGGVQVSALMEIEYFGRHFESRMLQASLNGDIDERMVDYVWRRYRTILAEYDKQDSTVLDRMLHSDLGAKMNILNRFKDFADFAYGLVS